MGEERSERGMKLCQDLVPAKKSQFKSCVVNVKNCSFHFEQKANMQRKTGIRSFHEKKLDKLGGKR